MYSCLNTVFDAVSVGWGSKARSNGAMQGSETVGKEQGRAEMDHKESEESVTLSQETDEEARGNKEKNGPLCCLFIKKKR